MDRQPYEQTYRLIQQLAGPFTGQMQAAARASHNEAEFRSRITRLAELSHRAHELAKVWARRRRRRHTGAISWPATVATPGPGRRSKPPGRHSITAIP